VKVVQHVSDDDLVKLAMRTLPDSETGPIAGHLLICQPCRDSLQTTGEFLPAMHSAAAKIRRDGAGE
jgi:hypothetical protein